MAYVVRRDSDGKVLAEVTEDQPEKVLVDEDVMQPPGMEMAMRQMKAVRCVGSFGRLHVGQFSR